MRRTDEVHFHRKRYKRVRWKYAEGLQAGKFNREQEEFSNLVNDWEKSNGRP